VQKTRGILAATLGINTSMSGASIALIAVGPGIAAFVVAAAYLSQRNAVCPSCSNRALRRVQFIRATVMVNGKRAPDSWSFFACDSCGARLKQHTGREYTVASEAEWNQYCTK
jgi:hypothetical protein